MLVKLDSSKAKQLSYRQYAVRFVLGGIITAAAGILAMKFGPAFGGLFLAFPAIFPASVTLVERSERRTKRQKHLHGEKRARGAAVLDSYGAALGSVALLLFALLLWLSIGRFASWIVLLAGTAVWSGSAILLWAGSRGWRHRRGRAASLRYRKIV